MQQATQRQETQTMQQQDSIASHITVRLPSPVYELSSSDESSSSNLGPPLVDDDEPLDAGRSQSEPPQAVLQPPPASTAPPAIRGGRPVRKRAGTGFYSALLGGDSQEIKRARQL